MKLSEFMNEQAIRRFEEALQPTRQFIEAMQSMQRQALEFQRALQPSPEFVEVMARLHRGMQQFNRVTRAIGESQRFQQALLAIAKSVEMMRPFLENIAEMESLRRCPTPLQFEITEGSIPRHEADSRPQMDERGARREQSKPLSPDSEAVVETLEWIRKLTDVAIERVSHLNDATEARDSLEQIRVGVDEQIEALTKKLN